MVNIIVVIDVVAIVIVIAFIVLLLLSVAVVVFVVVVFSVVVLTWLEASKSYKKWESPPGLRLTKPPINISGLIFQNITA